MGAIGLDGVSCLALAVVLGFLVRSLLLLPLVGFLVPGFGAHVWRGQGKPIGQRAMDGGD
jgi:predicted Kef-type K+ transport protein